jgi:galactose-1-phosphate uridylyltransferase
MIIKIIKRYTLFKDKWIITNKKVNKNDQSMKESKISNFTVLKTN